jgi:hypothetical protein
MGEKTIDLKMFAERRGMLFSEMKAIAKDLFGSRVRENCIRLSEEEFENLEDELDRNKLPVLTFFSGENNSIRHVLVMEKEKGSYNYVWYSFTRGTRHFYGKIDVNDFKSTGYLSSGITDIIISDITGELAGYKKQSEKQQEEDKTKKEKKGGRND